MTFRNPYTAKLPNPPLISKPFPRERNLKEDAGESVVVGLDMVAESLDIGIRCLGALGGTYLGLAGTHFEQTIMEAVAVADYFEERGSVVNASEIGVRVAWRYGDIINTVCGSGGIVMCGA